jgi:hypothetical protein
MAIGLVVPESKTNGMKNIACVSSQVRLMTWGRQMVQDILVIALLVSPVSHSRIVRLCVPSLQDMTRREFRHDAQMGAYAWLPDRISDELNVMCV